MQSSKTAKSTDPLGSSFNPSHYFALVSAVYLSLLSTPLLLFPRVLLLLSTPRGSAGQAAVETADGGAAKSQGVSALGPELTPIERFLSYAWGVAMLGLALLTLVQTGVVPLTSAPLADASASGKASPYRFPSVLVLTLYYASVALIAWASVGTAPSAIEADSPSEIGIGKFGMMIALPHGLLAFWGAGVCMFGDDQTRNKKKTDPQGKDRATSSFPFKNQYAEEEKNKQN